MIGINKTIVTQSKDVNLDELNMDIEYKKYSGWVGIGCCEARFVRIYETVIIIIYSYYITTNSEL